MKNGKWMRGAVVCLAVCGAAFLSWTAQAEAQESARAEMPAAAQAKPVPECVVMQFTDDTRFKKMGSDRRITEYLMNDILKSGKFRLKVEKPITQDMEAMLYDDKRAEVQAAKDAIESGDLSAVFEGPAFADESAQTLATASKGQSVAPAVTARIGKDAGADYLIQGTIVQLGQGSWEDSDFNTAKTFIGFGLSFLRGGSLFSDLVNHMDRQTAGFSVLADLRVIQASTGTVIWTDRVEKRAGKSETSFIIGKSGSTDLSETDYVHALKNAAEALVDDLVKAVDDKTLVLD